MTGAKKSWTCSNASSLGVLAPKCSVIRVFSGSSTPLKRAAPNHHSAWMSITSCLKPGTVPSSDQLQNQRFSWHGLQEWCRHLGVIEDISPSGCSRGVLFVGRAKNPSGFSLHIQSDYIRYYTVHYCTTFFCIRTCRCCLFLWKLCEMWWFPLEVLCYLWWGTPFIITLDGCEILHQSVDAWFSWGKPIDYLQCFILTNSYPLVI